MQTSSRRSRLHGVKPCPGDGTSPPSPSSPPPDPARRCAALRLRPSRGAKLSGDRRGLAAPAEHGPPSRSARRSSWTAIPVRRSGRPCARDVTARRRPEGSAPAVGVLTAQTPEATTTIVLPLPPARPAPAISDRFGSQLSPTARAAGCRPPRSGHSDRTHAPSRRPRAPASDAPTGTGARRGLRRRRRPRTRPPRAASS